MKCNTVNLTFVSSRFL